MENILGPVLSHYVDVFENINDIEDAMDLLDIFTEEVEVLRQVRERTPEHQCSAASCDLTENIRRIDETLRAWDEKNRSHYARLLTVTEDVCADMVQA